jgi:hypothetical protein
MRRRLALGVGEVTSPSISTGAALTASSLKVTSAAKSVSGGVLNIAISLGAETSPPARRPGEQ